MTNKDPPAARVRQHPEPVSVSDLPPLEPIPAPAEGNDQAGPTRDEVLRQAALLVLRSAFCDAVRDLGDSFRFRVRVNCRPAIARYAPCPCISGCGVPGSVTVGVLASRLLIPRPVRSPTGYS